MCFRKAGRLPMQKKVETKAHRFAYLSVVAKLLVSSSPIPLSKKSCSSMFKTKLSPAQKSITLFQLKWGLHTHILDILDFVGSNAGFGALGKLSFTCQCRVSENEQTQWKRMKNIASLGKNGGCCLNDVPHPEDSVAAV